MLHKTLLFALMLMSAGVSAQFSGAGITGTSNALTDIFMIDASVGFAGGVDGILKTTDGGATWTLLPYFGSTLPFGQREYFTNLNDIKLLFLDSQVGYAFGWNASGNYEEIIKTTDGGTTWQVQHYFNPDTAPFQSLAKRLRDASPLSTNTLITVGHRGRILKTNDGGASWVVKVTGTVNELEAVSFLDQNTGIVAGEQIVLRTSDGGESWSTHTMSHDFTDIQYIKTDLILATTSAGQILKSTDGGINWTSTGFQHDAAMTRVFFLTEQLGFIIGNGILLKTNDGGAHFEKYLMPNFNLTGLHALSENKIFVTTARSELFRVVSGTIPFGPISNFSADKTYTCDNSGEPITFSNLGPTGNQYQWLIDDEVIASTYNFSHEFQTSGTYEVSLKAFNGVAYDTKTITVFVTTTLPITKELMLFDTGPDIIELNEQTFYDRFYISNLQAGVDYQVFRNGVAISAKQRAQNVDIIRSIEIRIPPVQAGGTYEFTVRAELTSTCGIATIEKSFNRLILAVPKKPTNVTGYHLVNNGVRLEWYDLSTQETHYQIERKSESSAYEVIGTVSGFGSLRFIDGASLTTHQRYSYRIAGVNAEGISEYSTPVSMFMHGDIIYVNPGATGANNGSSWQDALTDVRQAFTESTADDEVWVVKGTYKPAPAKPWIVSDTKGIFGGFTGAETARNQRNWKLNKTIFSGDIGITGDRSDNVEQIISIQRGTLSGVTLTGAKVKAATIEGYFGEGRLSDCIVESNDIGVSARDIDKCIIRNNGTGVKGSANITNSFVYNNTYGVECYQCFIKIANSTFYANKLGSLKVEYLNAPHDVAITVYSSVFGYTSDAKLFDLFRVEPSFFESIIGAADYYGGWKVTRRNFYMNYMRGDDGILGNEDDILYFPVPEFQNEGAVRSSFDFPYFGNLDKDFFYNPRLKDNVLDIGPAEFVSDTIRIPDIKTRRKDDGVEISWGSLQDGVTRIWLERTEQNTGETVFIPVSASLTSFTDTSADKLKAYNYRIRLQKNDLVSFPGVRHEMDVIPVVSIAGTPLNNFYNQINYQNSYPFATASAELQVSAGEANDFQKVADLAVSSQAATYNHRATAETLFYRIYATFTLPDGSVTSTYSDTLKIITLSNQAPVITGQTPSSIFEGKGFQFSKDLLTVDDDHDFPLGFTSEILAGDHYTINGPHVAPEPGFIGDIFINVRISDHDLPSAVYPFRLEVKPRTFTAANIQASIMEGSSIQITRNFFEVTDNLNTAVDFTVTPLPGNNYTVANSIVTPASNFTGELAVNVTINIGSIYSVATVLTVAVNPFPKPTITGQSPIRILQGRRFKILRQHLLLGADVPSTADVTIRVLPGVDYTVSTEDSVSFVNNSAGPRKILVDIFDGHKRSDVYEFALTVVSRIEGEFAASQTKVVANKPLNFTSTYSGNPTSFQWKFEGASPSTAAAQNPENIIYKNPGTYSVELTMQDDLQKVVVLKESYVTVVPLLQADFTVSKTQLHPNDEVDFSCLPKSSIISWLWEFEGAVPSTSTDENPKNIRYKTSGTYNVRLTVDDGFQKTVILKEALIRVDVVTDIETTGSNDFQVYPNPTRGQFFISGAPSAHPFDAVIKITNAEGKTVLATETTVNAPQSNLAMKLPSGAYIISIEFRGKVLHRKLIVL